MKRPHSITRSPFLAVTTILIYLSAAIANAGTFFGTYNINVNGAFGQLVLTQPDPNSNRISGILRISGTTIGDPIKGFYSATHKTAVWVRGSQGESIELAKQPYQAYIGTFSTMLGQPGGTIKGDYYDLKAGGNVVRNKYAFSADQTIAKPFIPNETLVLGSKPTNLIGLWAMNANNYIDTTLLGKPNDPSAFYSARMFGEFAYGSYAPSKGTVALLRWVNGEPGQVFVGQARITSGQHVISGNFYPLNDAAAGGSAETGIKFNFTATRYPVSRIKSNSMADMCMTMTPTSSGSGGYELVGLASCNDSAVRQKQLFAVVDVSTVASNYRPIWKIMDLTYGHCLSISEFLNGDLRPNMPARIMDCLGQPYQEFAFIDRAAHVTDDGWGLLRPMHNTTMCLKPFDESDGGYTVLLGTLWYVAHQIQCDGLTPASQFPLPEQEWRQDLVPF